SRASIRAAVCSVNSAELPMQQHLKHEFAAEVAQHEQQRATEDPFERASTAPAVAPAAEQQNREDDPSSDGKNVLVRERHGFTEKLLGKQDSGREREREQDERRGDQTEQIALERQQRTRAAARLAQAAVQLLFQARQHER